MPLNELAPRPGQCHIGGWAYLPQGEPNPLLDEHGQHRHNLLLQPGRSPPPHFLPDGARLPFLLHRDALTTGTFSDGLFGYMACSCRRDYALLKNN